MTELSIVIFNLASSKSSACSIRSSSIEYAISPLKDALSNMGVREFLTSEVTFVPNNEVTLDDETKEKVYNLIEALEDIDDVQDVHHNMKED